MWQPEKASEEFTFGQELTKILHMPETSLFFKHSMHSIHWSEKKINLHNVCQFKKGIKTRVTHKIIKGQSIDVPYSKFSASFYFNQK